MKLVDIFTAKRLVNIKSIAFSLLFIVLSLAIPFIGSAQVLVSEVAWMGTDDDANNEWIELYNLSSTATDLAGWTLSDGASIAISLTGILLPHRTGVLERTDDTTLPGTALLIYTGALSNSGGTLTLKDAGGTTADQVFGGTDWVDIGGSNVVPKKTPQRTRTGSWVTGTPTPGADNVQVSTPVATTVSETSTSGTAVSSTRTSSGSSTGVKKATAKIEKDPFLELTFEAPNVVYVNQEIEFEAMPRGIGKTLMNSLSYTWNFGDTYTASTKKTKHIFSYPGEYIVVSEARYANQKAQVRHEVTVLPVSFTIKKTNQGDILLTNESKQEVEIGGFTLRGANSFEFPALTFIKAKGTLIVPKSRIGKASTSVSLYDTQNVFVVTTSPERSSEIIQRNTFSRIVPEMTREVVGSSQRSIVKEETLNFEVGTGTEGELQRESRETIIQIGTTNEAGAAKQGIFGRFFSKILRLFTF